MEAVSKFILPGLLFILTLASGVWLSLSGKPLNTAIFTIHKLIALGTVIITAIQIYNSMQHKDVQTSLIALILVTGVCVIALFATGAMMSLGKPYNMILLTIHRVAPFLAFLSMATTVYQLAVRN